MCLPLQGIGYDKFVLGIASLGDVPGMPPAELHYPEAEYELMVVGLDPEGNPSPEDPITWRMLHPANVCLQFHGVSREMVTRIGQSLALGCIDGRLVGETRTLVQMLGKSEPQVKYIKQLVDMWKSSLDQLVQHEQTDGLHGTKLN